MSWILDDHLTPCGQKLDFPCSSGWLSITPFPNEIDFQIKLYGAALEQMGCV